MSSYKENESTKWAEYLFKQASSSLDMGVNDFDEDRYKKVAEDPRKWSSYD